ncbi:radical SAM protein [Thermodesulfobacteriota bacterium]
MSTPEPGFLRLFKNGALQQKALQLTALLSACRLCPRQCGIDRTRGETGVCGAPAGLRVARATAHPGEEPVISGTRGAGTIFFSHCSLSCCFCQNYQISQEGLGAQVSAAELARMMLSLQQQGCHNISLVSAAHFLPGILDALVLAAGQGLQLPIVYNSNGYERPEVLQLLEGVIDVYLPDAKYAGEAAAEKYSAVRDYARVNMAALQEMFRQTGPLVLDDAHIARSGLIIRHLVLPGLLRDTRRLLHRIKNSFGPFVPVSLMGQYTPCYRAGEHPELRTRLSPADYRGAIDLLENLGFENGWFQDCTCLDHRLVPDFSKPDSWN